MGTRRTLRIGLLTLACAFLAWEAFGALQWVLEAGGVGPAAREFWARLTSDWMLVIVVTDHLLLAGIVLVMMWVDAGRIGWAASRRLLLVAAFVALGSPVVLWYLARRLRESDAAVPAAIPT